MRLRVLLLISFFMLRATARVMSSFNKIPAVLPQLPYGYDALQPAISAQIMVSFTPPSHL